MNKCNSEICIQIEDFDLPNIEESITSKIMSRTRPCHLILDASSAKIGFGLLKRTKSIQNMFEKYRSQADELIGSSEIIVSSRPAAFLANIFIKIAKPSTDTTIRFQRK